MIPQPLFRKCSDDLKDSWRKENPVNKKAIAQHFARGAPKKNSELSVYASESEYDSGYDTHNSEGTWGLVSDYGSDGDNSNGEMEGTRMTANAASTRPSTSSLQYKRPRTGPKHKIEMLRKFELPP